MGAQLVLKRLSLGLGTEGRTRGCLCCVPLVASVGDALPLLVHSRVIPVVRGIAMEFYIHITYDTRLYMDHFPLPLRVAPKCT